MGCTLDERRRKHLFWILAALQVILLALILLLCNIKYEVSDDFMMEMVVSGAYNGRPDAHMMFSNIALGALLVPLYRLCPGVSWYFWGQMLLCLGAFLAMTYVLVQRLRPGAAVFTVVTITAVAARDLYILPQFTKTAVAASMCGLMLLIWSLFHKRGLVPSLIGGFLALLGALVRIKAFYIAVAFAGMYVIYESIRVLREEKWTWKQILLRAWGPGILLLGLVFGFGMADKLAYGESTDYYYYRQYSQARAQILDYTWMGYDQCRSEFQRIGLSENDYEMILGWDFADPQVFSLEKMQQVRDIVNAHRKQLRPGLWSALRGMRRQLRYPITICCLVLGLLCILGNWKNAWFPVLSAMMTAAFLVYFYFVGRWVYRVEFGFFFCAAVLIACFCQPILEKDWVEPVLCIAAVLTMMTQVRYYIPDQSWREMSDEEYRSYADSILNYSWNYDGRKYSLVVEPGTLHPNFLRQMRENPDNLYILDFNTTIQSLYYDFGIYQSSSVAFPKNALYLAGVTEYHPSVQTYASSLGYDNLMDALLDENVYFVSNDSWRLILQFYREHGRENVQIISCGEVDGYRIWRFTQG